MFVLPLGYDISVRKPANSIRKLVEAVVPKWKGTRLNIIFQDCVHISVNASKHVRLLRFADSWVHFPETIEFAPRESARTAERRGAIRGVSGLIEPGHAVVLLNGRQLEQSHPTFYVHQLTADLDAQAELAVARDAYYTEGSYMKALAMVRKVIPNLAALYMTMLDHEAKHLNKTIERTAYA